MCHYRIVYRNGRVPTTVTALDTPGYCPERSRSRASPRQDQPR
jgi:hypothetical protein